MNFEFPIILRSRIEAAITRGRLHERKKVKDELEYEHKQEVIRLEDKFKLMLSEKDSEIKLLEMSVDLMKKEVESAARMRHEAKIMVIKSKEVVTTCQVAFKNHIESQGRVFSVFENLRLDIQKFNSKMIE